MSWSNLVDYFQIPVFHDLAFELSHSDTQHYGYTMNWPTVTYGADILDYETLRDRIHILDDLCYGKSARQKCESTAGLGRTSYMSASNMVGASREAAPDMCDRGIYFSDCTAKTGIGLAYEGLDDCVSATYWYKQAADFPPALACLGLLRQIGHIDGICDLVTARHLNYRSAEQGYARAQRLLGSLFFYGEVVDLDMNIAAFWLEKTADQGDTKSQSLFALLLCHGKTGLVNGHPDYETSKKLYELAAAKGN
eukprot:scaffold4457_cov169-Amphora_coffeaeformis.AAC.7